MNSTPSTLIPADLADLDVSELYDLGLWPPKKQFRVYYSLSGAMHVSAPNASQAGETAFARLHTLVGSLGTVGLTAEAAGQVGLVSTEVEIDSVEGIDRSGDGP